MTDSCTSSSATPFFDLSQTERADILTAMLNASIDSIKVINLDGTLMFVNKSGRSALRLNENARDFGMSWVSLLPKALQRRAKSAIKKVINGKSASFMGHNTNHINKVVFWEHILTPVTDIGGDVKKILCVSRDITHRINMENKLKAITEIDELTGLPNRRGLKKHLEKIISNRKKIDGKFGLLFIDLDDFKRVNDTFGHVAGDKLLQFIAKQFKKIQTENVFFSRLGGDEFAIVVNDMADTNTLSETAKTIIEKVVKTVNRDERYKNFTMSIGGAIYSDLTESSSRLMKLADMAMYYQKCHGKNGFNISD